MLLWLLEIKTAFGLFSTMFKMLAWIVAAIWYLIFLIPRGPALSCHRLCTQGQKKKKMFQSIQVNPNNSGRARTMPNLSVCSLLPSRATNTPDRELSVVTIAKIY